MKMIISNNKKAYFDYFIEEKIECGIELKGSEVKVIKTKGTSIKEALIKIINNECFILGMNVEPSSNIKLLTHESNRDKKLLLHKKEIEKLNIKIKESGYTLVPLVLYINDHGLLKLEIGLAKGKKKYDKRESLKKKDIEKRIRSNY